MDKITSLTDCLIRIQGHPKVLVYFYHDHCANCPNASRYLQGLEPGARAAGWTFLKFNVEETEGAGHQWGIGSVPFALLFVNGLLDQQYRFGQSRLESLLGLPGPLPRRGGM